MSTPRSKGESHSSSPPPTAQVPLVRDTDLSFPRFVLLKASAGSGKTHALSLWFVQLLLSETIGEKTPNDLRNILAITFTRNAAREMRTRILSWLKDLYFGDDVEKTNEILGLVSLDPRSLSARSGRLLEDLLGRYSDFQVETIDSFMTSVFKASALDLGVPPHFEVLLDNSGLLEYAFSRFLRKVTPRSAEGDLFLKISELISSAQRAEGPFAWDPTALILEKITALHARMTAQTQEPDLEDLEERRRSIEPEISAHVQRIRSLIEDSGLEPNRRSTFYSRVEPAVRDKRYSDLQDASYKTVPVKKPRTGVQEKAYEDVARAWLELEALDLEYQTLRARQYFRPYLLAMASFADTLEAVKRRKEAVFIEDIPKRLSSYIEAGIVPDIYFRLGDRIAHFLIDEFQDTSPIQWANLRPLIENSLAEKGSLLVVGDTKQAIYGFREADYRIMRDLEKKKGEEGHEGFDSVGTTVGELPTNFRSGEKILDFVKHIFLERLAQDEELGSKEDRSGLTEFRQEVEEELKGRGYVTLTLLDSQRAAQEEDEEEGGTDRAGARDQLPERTALLARIKDLSDRGYAHSDIAVLTYKNKTVVEVSSWLSEAAPPIPFIPFSSLDIRTRAITREVLALLTFLDSPPDDLAFAEFLLGGILGKKMETDGHAASRETWHGFLFDCRRGGKRPLYIALRQRHPELWEAYFERLFRLVGYYPLYDLAALIYGTFDVFRHFPEEEATLVKLLESIKDFEAAGKNDLGEFLEMTSRQDKPDPAWNIEVPLNIDAVRVMSIHKAKGLQFPVVILLQYAQRYLPPEFYLEARGETVRVLKLNMKLAERNPDFGCVYKEARDRHDVDRLNALYVALTRASAELHIIGVRSPARKSDYPFNLLDDSLPRSWGEGPRQAPKTEVPATGELTLRFRTEREAPPATRAELHFENIRRGLFFHDLLARVVFLEEGWEARLREMIREQGEAAADWAAEAERVLSDFFSRSPLRAYFEHKQERGVFTEFNICDPLGRLFRLDRVVVDPEGVTVLDYKTGDTDDPEARQRRDEDDRAQMRLYLRLAAEIFPGRPVRGILAYVDRGTWEELE